MAILKLDRERVLRFNVAAARKFKQLYGTPLYLVRVVKADGLEMLDHDCLCHILWAGLQHEDRRLTVDRVAELLDELLKAKRPLTEVYEAVAEAFDESGLFGVTEGKAPETEKTS